MINRLLRLFRGDHSEATDVSSKVSFIPEQYIYKLVAVHRAPVSPESLRAEIDADPNFTWLTWDYLLWITESLYIFDMWFANLGMASKLIEGITQPTDHGQAPWSEHYFSEDGMTLLSDDEFHRWTPEEEKVACRLRFYMHFVDLDAPLEIDGKQLALPKPTPLPPHMEELMYYKPPD